MQPSQRSAQHSPSRPPRAGETDQASESAPRTPAPTARTQGEHSRVSRRVTAIVPDAQQASTRTAHQVPATQRHPRTNLCARTTRYLALGLGLGIALGLCTLGTRLIKRSATSESPPLDPDTQGSSWGIADGARAQDGAGGESASHASITDSLEKLERYEPQAIGHELNPLVAGFRSSTGWRDVGKLFAFMETLTRAIARNPSQSAAHLAQLLQVWSWRFEETFRAKDGSDVNVGALMTSSIVRPVVTQLGGPRITDAHLRLLVATISREPDDILPGEDTTKRMADHAMWVASALRQVVLHTATDWNRVTLTKRQASEEAQLRRCLRMVLEAPSQDPRWTPLIAMILPDVGPVPEWGLRMTPARWVSAVFDEFSQHVNANYKGQTIPYYEHETLKALVQKAAAFPESEYTAQMRKKHTIEEADGTLRPKLSPDDLHRLHLQRASSTPSTFVAEAVEPDKPRDARATQAARPLPGKNKALAS